MEKYKVIIDANIWISFLLGKRLSSLRSLCGNERLSIYICEKLMDEFTDVVLRPKISKSVAQQDIVDTIVLMKRHCITQSVSVNAVSPIRDKNDLYLLSLADTISANYLITGDKDLLVLQHHNQTKIVAYTEFMTILETMSNKRT
ncbi:hypothetical protein AGMMS4956_11750 [Bacteroidia bacterium]|nr:hypothetical protein AGMMS4956_11750 [Bacteroidia bacterium]